MGITDDTLGAAYLGLLVAAVLYGVTSVQTFIYTRNTGHDPGILRWTVAFLWLLDTIHFAFIAHGLYVYLITNFGHFFALEFMPWTILAHIYITAISDTLVRGLFTRRIFILCGDRKIWAWCLVISINVFSLLSAASGIAFGSKGLILRYYTKLTEAAPLLYTSFACNVVADISIAASLCTLLIQRRTGFESRRMDSVLTTLMGFSINTGLLTSMCALVCLITYALWPQHLIYLAAYFTLSKLYLNAFLASLNARRTFQQSISEVSTPIVFPMIQTNPVSGTARTVTADSEPCGSNVAEEDKNGDYA